MRSLIRFHKRLIAMLQVNLGLSDYQVVWLSFAKGVLLGVLGALGELDSPSLSHPATIVAMVSCVPVLLMIASLLKDVFRASRLRDTLDYSDTAATGNEADIIDDIGEAKVGGEDGPADEH